MFFARLVPFESTFTLGFASQYQIQDVGSSGGFLYHLCKEVDFKKRHEPLIRSIGWVRGNCTLFPVEDWHIEISNNVITYTSECRSSLE